MQILLNNFSNKYKERVFKKQKEVTYIQKTPLCNIFGNSHSIRPLLQSLLMESYVEVYTGKFKMHNNQNTYFTSNLHEMLENLLMLIQRKQIYF